MLQPPHRSRPPGPPSLPIIGQSWHFGRDPLAFFCGLARDYGDFVFVRLGGQDVYFISHPELVREVLTVQRAKFEIANLRTRLEIALGKGLLTSRGELHARQRRLMQPVFRKSRIDSYADLMADYTQRQCEGWSAGAELDITGETGRLALRIVAKSLLGHDADADTELVSRNLSTWMKFFQGVMSPFIYLRLALPLPSTLSFRRAKTELDRMVYAMIAHRKEQPSDADDLLTLLMQATDEQTDTGMSVSQLRDEVLTLILAGHETTASVLAWSIYLLAQDPGAQRKVHDEIRTVLAGRSRPEPADMPRLACVRQVILESLRLYPPGWLVGRVALEDTSLGGYAVPKGTNVLTSQFVMHRDARSFERPLEFRPERWTESFMKNLPLGAYFPFSAGERHCIGENFAWLEATLVLAMLLDRWRFEPVPGQDIRPTASITLRPNAHIRVRPYRW